MLVSIVVAFIAYVILSLFYIHRLHKRLRGYEHVWEQIEQVADANQDGTFNINIQHLEDVHPNEVHTNVEEPSGVRLLNLGELEARTDDGPPRAA